MAVDGGIIINMIHKVQLKCINFHVMNKIHFGLYNNVYIVKMSVLNISDLKVNK